MTRLAWLILAMGLLALLLLLALAVDRADAAKPTYAEWCAASDENAEWCRHQEWVAYMQDDANRDHFAYTQTGECRGWHRIIWERFGDEGRNACTVMACESDGNPDARSRTNDHGLLQIHAGSRGFPGGWQSEFRRVTGVPFFDGVYDPTLNVQFAHWLHSQSGWSPWACARQIGLS